MILRNLTLSQKQRDVIRWFTSDQKWLMLSGTVRSGKSFALDLGWLIWTQAKWKEPTDFIIAGHSVGSVKRNVMPEMERFARALGINWKFGYSGSVISAGIHKYHIFGSKDADSVEALRGMTAGGAYLDEMTLMHQDFIAMAITRCSLTGSKIIGSTNPSFPAHFIKTDYIDRVEELRGNHIEMGFPDNPVLDPEYVEGLRRTLTGADYERLFLGKWVANSGLVHPQYDTISPDKIPSDISGQGSLRSRYTLAIDYATSSVVHALLCKRGEKDLRDTTFIVDEWRHDAGTYGVGAAGQYPDQELVERLSGFLAEHSLTTETCEILPDPTAVSFRRACQKEGWRVRSVNNDILEGVRITNIALTLGKIKISSKCKHLIKELGTYLWDEKKCERGEDIPLKTRVHHGVDALRYFAMRYYRYLGMTGTIKKPEGW